MHIIYGKVYSLLKLTSKRVVVLDDQEYVWRHFRSNCYFGRLSGGILSHPFLEDPQAVIFSGAPADIMCNENCAGRNVRYRGVTVTANAVMILPDHVLVSRSNSYGLRRNCSGYNSSKRKIATT